MTVRRPTGTRRPRAPGPTPDDILAPFAPRIRRIAEEMRALVRRAIPTAYERAYPGWRAIGFRDPQAGYFCGLFPSADLVLLCFERGAELQDPDGLFAPRRELRQVRFVELSSLAAVRRPALRRMLERAVLHGSMR